MKEGTHYLITFADWFVAPDGNQYKSAWGKFSLVDAKPPVPGFGGAANSTTKKVHRVGDDDVKLGEGDKSLIAKSSLITYAVECAKKPAVLEGAYTLKDDSRQHINNLIYITE